MSTFRVYVLESHIFAFLLVMEKCVLNILAPKFCRVKVTVSAPELSMFLMTIITGISTAYT